MQTSRTIAQGAATQQDVRRHEHPQTSAAVSSCCAPVKQETCCAPADKDACCGTPAAGTAAPGGCGCQ
jgi:hypothetical protein